jgi:hypothetical protein
MPGPSPHRAVMIPRGIKYSRATRVVSSTSRKKKNIAVMKAISTKASRYCQRRDSTVELRMFAEFIIPF